MLPLIRASGLGIAAYRSPDPGVNLGVNDRVDLARATEEARRRILEAHMRDGVTVLDPRSTWIDADVELAPDVTIAPGTMLRGATSVGSGSVIGPMTTLLDARLGERVTVPHSYLTQCEVADGASIGPFAYLRPDAKLGQDSKAGAFVEIKNSQIGEGAKVPHLSYVGDAEIGAGSNLGAGTITANYDGFRKHRTKVGRDAKLGVDTALVAPVEVGDGAYTGAGSVITEDVPAGALGHIAGRSGERRGVRRAQGQGVRIGSGLGVGEEGLVSTVEERTQPISAITQDYTKRLMVFGGRASMELAANIARHLDVDLGDVTLKTFSNGEVYCRYEQSIRGADVFLVQSTAANDAAGMTPNDALMELLTMIDAAQGASAHRIIAVMPWYGYARQDKKSAPREPISARIVAKALESVGVDRVLTMDLHAGQVQGFFDVPAGPHDRDADADPVRLRPRVRRGAGDRLARRRPREDGAQLRPPRRLHLGRDGEGAPRPPGRRDRLRGRRRAGQDGRARRRHDRHRRHARPRRHAPCWKRGPLA